MPPTPSVPLHIDAALEEGVAHLTLTGELTYGTAPLFTAQITEVVDRSRPLLVLDVARLHFCDSVGLSALIGAHRRARAGGGDVVLTGVHGSLARSLAVTGVGALFGVVEAGIVEARAGADPPASDRSGCAGEPA